MPTKKTRVQPKAARRVQEAAMYAAGGYGYQSLLSPSPFPPRLRKDFVYGQILSCASTATLNTSGPTDAVFLLNSLFAPFSSGPAPYNVGHQPYGRDQFAVFYYRYNVQAVTIEIFPQPKNYSTAGTMTTHNYLLLSIVQSSGNSNTLSGQVFDTFAEKPGVNIIPVTANLATSWKKTYRIAQIEGVPEGKVRDDDVYSAVMTASPATSPTLRINVLDGEAAANTYYVNVRITFHTEMFERQDLGPS